MTLIVFSTKLSHNIRTIFKRHNFARQKLTNLVAILLLNMLSSTDKFCPENALKISEFSRYLKSPFTSEFPLNFFVHLVSSDFYHHSHLVTTGLVRLVHLLTRSRGPICETKLIISFYIILIVRDTFKISEVVCSPQASTARTWCRNRARRAGGATRCAARAAATSRRATIRTATRTPASAGAGRTITSHPAPYSAYLVTAT